MVSCEPLVLLVDDDAQAVTSLARVLKGLLPSYRIEGTSLGTLATARAEAETIDVMVLDLELDPKQGVESGLAVLRTVQKCSPATRIVVLTGHSSQEYGIRALHLGAASFLEKPADPVHLAALVKDGVLQSSIRRSADRQTQLIDQHLLNDLAG